MKVVTEGERAGTGPASGHHPEQTGVSDPLFRRIVVPVDFSAPSLKALDYAQSLAQQLGAEIQLIHIVEPTPFMSSLVDLPILRPDAEVAKQWEGIIGRLARERSTPVLKVTSEVRIGKPSHEIAAAAVAAGADLLVTATHGRTGLQHVLLGSTAERIVRHAPCPVLVFRERTTVAGASAPRAAESVQPRRIIVATDFSSHAQSALQLAGRFATQFGAELILLHCVYYPGSELGAEYRVYDTAVVTEASTKAAEGAMATLLRENVPAQLTARSEVRIGPPLGEIPEVARELCADLIVCGAHGHTGLPSALLGSTAEGIVRHAPCSVLVIPAQVG